MLVKSGSNLENFILLEIQEVEMKLREEKEKLKGKLESNINEYAKKIALYQYGKAIKKLNEDMEKLKDKKKLIKDLFDIA